MGTSLQDLRRHKMKRTRMRAERKLRRVTSRVRMSRDFLELAPVLLTGPRLLHQEIYSQAASPKVESLSEQSRRYFIARNQNRSHRVDGDLMWSK